MTKYKIFNDIDGDLSGYYSKHGYLHIRFSSSSFKKDLLKVFAWAQNFSGEEAFKNSDGDPRQFIDVMRESSLVRKIFFSDELIAVIQTIFNDSNSYSYFTHSKLSFKTPGRSSLWLPHQDNGYKLNSGSYLRQGFALFIPLEKMRKDNGQLLIWPGSHLAGTVKHNKEIEHHESGDNQVTISPPTDIAPLPIDADVGDIIIFSGDTFHASGNSVTESKRFGLIAEVENSLNIRLDDYGLFPICINKPPLFLEIKVRIRSLFSYFRYWRIIKSYPKLAYIFRKLKNKI